ncbi:MAG: hypothetical protein WC702_03055 [Patescibacteria group bacterium]|jgi:hypothetical protein
MDKKFVIFVDWSGTLCCDKFWRRLRDQDEMKVAHEKIFGDGPALHDDWMRGQYSSEEINSLVAEWTGLPYDLLWQDFTATCCTMVLDNALVVLWS